MSILKVSLQVSWQPGQDEVMVRIVRISVRVRLVLVLIGLELGWEWKIAPLMYICLSLMENNTEPD